MSKLKKVLFWIVAFYLLLIVLLYFLQNKIIFQPERLALDYTYQFDYNFEEFFLDTKDGARLNALHFKVSEPKGVILYFHGNKGNLSRWGRIASFFVEKQYDVVVMDYRSYGKSTGVIKKEENLYEDAQLFYDYVLNNYDEDNIIIYGRSLGTGIATNIASQNKPGNLVLETPFSSMGDVTSYWLPIFPVSSVLKFKFPSDKFIQKVSCKITIYHGTKDRVVPYSSGKKLFESLISSHKKLITITGGSHNNLIKFDGYQNTIDDVLEISSQ
ncbi:alpha/beta hydrolase [Aquimarina litoralis]|uniref:alpha/beta hydrolase n=1 Tax=Aquimarina litoralis TaxID=584605 RepID=UPI001C59336B|nr:alpha/beta fold hydrolase [Aquimarina litoralis]MBW1295178.1 alpha/beta fold hydrolase [Aquimarina litoralis]